MIELLPQLQHRRQPWKNAGGYSFEISRDRDDPDWGWRASIAEIGHDGPFSRFPQCERQMVLLDGPGLDLHFDAGETRALRPPHGDLRFAGDRPVHARLVAGPVRCFNLIWRQDRYQVQLLHRPLVGSMWFFDEPATTWLLFVLAGQAVFPEPARVLERHDAALWPAAAGRVRLEGEGELLLAQLRTLPTT